MTAAFLLLSVLCLFLACLLVMQARSFYARETALIDRLLKQNGVQPITIERERVVKLPDAEIPPLNDNDLAMFIDEIKEELEQSYPEVARMSHTEARTRYPHDWARMQKKLQMERAPLRAD